MSPTAGDETPRGRNPEIGRRRDFGRRRRHRQSGFQHTDRPRPSSPELLNKDHNAGRESLSHLDVSFVKFTDFNFLWYMNLMNNAQTDRGNENPTQHLPWWLRKTTKKPSQVGRHRDLNQGPPECESRALPRSHLVRYMWILYNLLWMFLRVWRKSYRMPIWQKWRVLKLSKNTFQKFSWNMKYSIQKTHILYAKL